MVDNHTAEKPRSARSDEPGAGVVERRVAPRYPAGRVGFRSAQIQANLVDLSRGGLAIDSLEHPPIGGVLAFALEQGSARVDVEARVRWCRVKRTYRNAEGDIVPVYRAGLRLGLDRPPLLDSITRTARLDWMADHA